MGRVTIVNDIPCKCSCHRSFGVKHVTACCDWAGINISSKVQPPEDKEGKMAITNATGGNITSGINPVNQLWRTGRRNHRIIYMLVDEEASDFDPMIGVMDNIQLAREAVQCHNARVNQNDMQKFADI